jgi:uncharacterized membrane protein YqjE
MGKLEPAAFESLERIGYTLVSQLRRRLQLMAVEVTEEEIRFARILGWQLIALFFSCMTVALAVLLVIAGFWDSPMRLEAIGWTLLVASLVSGSMWWMYRKRLSRKPIVFHQTIAELEKDARALDPVPPAPSPAAAGPAGVARP